MAKAMFTSCTSKPMSHFTATSSSSTMIQAVAPFGSWTMPVKFNGQESGTGLMYTNGGRTKLVKPICRVAETVPVKKCEPVLVRPLTKTYNGSYYLSVIDETVVFPIEILYSFKAEDTKRTDNVYEVIKNALAQMLVHFYPLTGKLTRNGDGKYMINCTGEGVYFVEAVSECELVDVGDIGTPNPAKLRRFLHFVETKDIVDMPLFTVQVTKFKCGGFVVGMVGNHCTMDATSLCMFLNSWAQAARGLPLSAPFIDRSILKARKFSPIEFLKGSFSKIDNINMISKKGDASDAVINPKDGEMVYKSIEFSHEKLIKLKKIVIEEGITRLPTDFELLTAFLWRALLRSHIVERPEQAKLLMPVDARRKISAFPDRYFGNCLGVGYHISKTDELIEKPLSLVVKEVQDAIQMVTAENIELLITLGEFMGLTISYKNAFAFSNLSRMPFYEVDFGWGTPKQFGFATLPKNIAFFPPQQMDRSKKVMVLGLPPSSLQIFEELIQF